MTDAMMAADSRRPLRGMSRLGLPVIVRAVIAACILCFCAGYDQAEAKRVALVIGNSAYRNVSPLANPQNDARLVANALAASGFDVQLAADLDKKSLETALREFSLDAMQADVAMVYFAGHGMEATGANWLLPVDANIRSFEDVPTAAVPFEMVARSLAGASVKIIALDACRDNPFAARLQSPTGVINRGLAEVELDGYVVIYAAAAGQVALDGDTNSPFARSFGRWVGEQTIDLRLLAGKIRDDVIATTAGVQRPFVSASLPGQMTTLAPSAAGKVRAAAVARQRMPYYFDYVRTLRDKACIQTREIKCQTEALTEAAGQIVTIEDDAKLRVWDTVSEAAARTESVSVPGVGPRDVTFLASASALAVTIDGNITMVPLSGGAAETHKIEHGNYPEFLFAAGTPAVAVYAYRSHCGFGVVDLGSFTLAGKTPWAPACMGAEIAWSLPDAASDRFVALVTTMIKREPHGGKELLLASYRSREIICRIDGGVNAAAFGADGDLYTAHDDGTIVRHDRSCVAKQTYRLHQGAVEQVLALTGGRLLSRSVDGAVKLWSPTATQAEKELAGLSREAQIVDVAEDGSAVLILNEDRRLYLWYGEPRLGPYIGPSGPVCAGALSADRDTIYALKCEGNVEVWRRQRPDN